ncbi:MAG: hypothetical protein AB1441_04925 [Bacillota bacterium]
MLLKAFVDRVAVYQGERLVAEHPRLYGKHQESIRLEHYLDVLYAKPRGIYNARPASQLPPVFCQYLNGYLICQREFAPKFGLDRRS